MRRGGHAHSAWANCRYNPSSVTTCPSQNADVRSVALICHPATPCRAVRRIDVDVRRMTETSLQLRYRLEGDTARLLIPAETTPRRADNLWQHTCFEAFVTGEGVAHGYCEFNFAPSTEWAIYRFSAYREGIMVVEARAPQCAVQRESDALSLAAVIDLAPVSALRGDPTTLRLALCAVVEEADHRLSYWALAHPAAKPDFHHAGGFTLVLPGVDSLSAGGRGRG
jgi:hypothetical protein